MATRDGLNRQRSGVGTSQTAFNQGLALHRGGRLDEAVRHYLIALALEPRQFDALHMLGVLCIQRGQLEEGRELIEEAIGVQPGVAVAHGNLANALNRLKRYEDALATCERAIAVDPNFADAYGNQGLALHQLGRASAALESYRRLAALRRGDAQPVFNQAAILRELGRLDEALAAFDRVVCLKPDHAEGYRARGLTLHDLGRREEALESLDRATALNPPSAEAHFDKGNTLLALQRPEDALACFDEAIKLRPGYAEAHDGRGTALNEIKQYQEALASYDQAIVLKPDYAQAYSNRVGPLRALQRPEEAFESCERAISLRPDYAEAHNNRMGALYDLRKVDEAIAASDRALALRPDFADAHNNRAVMLLELRRLDEALRGFKRAVALQPDYAEAHFNLAMCQLMLGDEANGWAEYEWRWRTDQFEHALRDLAAPLWLGRESLHGRTILLHAEQGLGDAIQFCRHVPQVAALGATVILEVPRGLERLLSSLDGVSQVVVRDAPLPRFEFQTPLMSLPLALGISPDDRQRTYLTPDPTLASDWQSRLADDRRFRVGLCWAGGARPDQPAADAIDRRRSLSLDSFALFADIPGVTFYSLQKGPPATQLLEAQARNWSGPAIIDLTAELKDFADTAALVANLDLIVTCDTSTAHLAGALGKPVWILNRFDACWRWLHNRDDSPWYPSARLFRQPSPGDWDTVAGEVGDELRHLAKSGHMAAA